MRSGGKLISRDQQGKVLAELFRQVSIATDKNAIKWIKRKIPGKEIDAETCVPMTRAGEHMDWNLAVGHLRT